LNQKKILSLYSGGLDSRLSIKWLKEKGYLVTAIHLNLPFISQKDLQDDFIEKENIELVVINCREGECFDKYISMLKKPSYGTGTSINPCIDCKIYMYTLAKEYAQNNGFDAIAVGEVPGQRPMSQSGNSPAIIAKDVDFPIVRPMVELNITGRSRKTQMQMAEKYQFNYPTPGGGCLLCEKGLKKRYQLLLDKNLFKPELMPLTNIGRHFYIDDKEAWYIVSRNQEESIKIEKYTNVIQSDIGKPAVWYHSEFLDKDSLVTDAKKLQSAYSKVKNIEIIEEFKQFKL